MQILKIVVLSIVVFAALCGAVMDKLMVGSCCNDDATYGYQESWSGRKYTVVGLYGEFCQSSFYDWAFGVILDEWNAGRVSHFTLSPDTSPGCFPNDVQPPASISDPNGYILSGNFDTYIASFVTHLTTFLAGPDGTLGNADDRRMYIRLSHELNGNWYPWSANATSYAAAWRYVWNKVMVGTNIKNTHVQWIFEPVSPYEPDAAHDFRLYWPGDQYVDWLSLDAYEDGSPQQGWYQPWEIFDNMLYKLRAWRPALPVAVSETGCPTNASQVEINWKSQWFTDLLPYLAGWNVQMVVYFNVNFDNGSGKKIDYPFFYTGNTGTDTYTAGNVTYHVYDAWKTAVQASAYEFSSTSNPRLMTDDEFLGRLPGYTTPPTMPRNLMIYTNGKNSYDWQCTPAGFKIVSLMNTTQHTSDEAYSLYVSLDEYAHVQFHSSHDGANTSFYQGIQFSIWTANANVQLSVDPYNKTNGNTIKSTAFTVTSAKTWQDFSWTWAELGVPEGYMLPGFYVTNSQGKYLGDCHMTKIQLTAAAPTWTLGTTSGVGAGSSCAPLFIMLFIACIFSILLI